MKKLIIISILVLVLTLSAWAQSTELNLGRTYFPKDFTHAGKNYTKGNYHLILIEKDGFPWFKVLNNKKELIFEEMAVVKANEGKRKNFKYRIRRSMLKGYEYFRIKVTKPDQLILAFFLVEAEKEKN